MSKTLFLESVAEIVSIENPQEILKFLEEQNCEILEKVILDSVHELKKEPYLRSAYLSFFECPFKSGEDAIYLNADFNISDYASVYRIEGDIFEKTINPHFKVLNFRFLLSFDSID
jgi:hypothetical protein